MGKFDGILLVSDLDGTLLDDNNTISDENIRAIEYFQKEGGLFTVMSGRPHFNIRRFTDLIKPDLPVGCFNGSVIYDFEKEKTLYRIFLDSDVKELIKYVFDEFEYVGIEYFTESDLYCIRENEFTLLHRGLLIKKGRNMREIESVDDKMIKVVLTLEPDKNDFVAEKLKELKISEKFLIQKSYSYLLEILSKDASKGILLKKITELSGRKNLRTYAAGDNDNDAAMLRTADVGIAVGNATKDAKDAADYITVTNNKNAIAHIIELIENKTI